MGEQATSDWHASAALSCARHAAVGAVAFGLLMPVTLLGLDLWDPRVEHSASAPSWDVGTLVGILYFTVLAGMLALGPALVLGVVLGAASGAVAALVVGTLVPPLVVGPDVLRWLRVLTGTVAGAACAVHQRYLVRHVTA